MNDVRDIMNSRHLIVAFPKVSQRNFGWIQTLRKKYDALSFNAITPHFTLFSPSDEFSRKDLVDATTKSIEGFMSFNFMLRSAILMPPTGGDHSYIFLVPDEGLSSFVKLRDQIYAGPLAKSLRLDIPFVPHLTVGSTRNLQDGNQIIHELNRQSFEIPGSIDSLSLVVEDGDRIILVEEVPFYTGTKA